ncbi:SDR family NAD(P)-dependent oxidoreductase [Couchioplanes caeruleus]|uniref:Acetoin dehydrogenase n=2 Tax=Couchioplanes caeruleus TaxID=56438 RepID=A0A1K0FTJ9_9ACTN|nr:acetoin dehydrogenase [Couchioplanes caeruleus subsp. caeruleus]OJF15992.1 acetoin dehydrogenase [Couchioplanes caeruleus subsp. caeruleus]ROP27849.1 short-subunit dehydrogenase [Couchioplanes caeruleus]
MTGLTPYRFAGRTAVVTGAAGGIGEQLAHGLAARGSDLVLADRDALRLDEVAESLRAAYPGRAIEAAVVDLADRDAVIAFAQGVRGRHPRLGLLINNAGVALGGRFDQVTVEEFEWVMAVNFTAPMLLMHHLLPSLTAEPGSHLVNISSLYGLIAPPGQSAYSASKFAIRGLSEVLRGELLENGVGVTTVHPGGVRTRIAESARIAGGIPADEVEEHQRMFAALLTYPPERAAADILDGVRHRRGRLLIAPTAKLPDLLARLLPESHMRLLAKLTETIARRGAAKVEVNK